MRSTQKFGPISSAILAFIGHKQTNRQPDKPSIYIYMINVIRRKFSESLAEGISTSMSAYGKIPDRTQVDFTDLVKYQI